MCVSLLWAANLQAQVEVGMCDTTAYLPLLRGQRVAVLANHTAKVGEMHLVDMLHDRGYNVVAIFSPEHGFRGAAGAGEVVKSSVDERTKIPILSLYNGTTKRPTDEAMQAFDCLVVDMQDVGLRFYTYYIAMIRMIDACADFGRKVIILDRPNPNGHIVDGPILDIEYKSGVGALPIPILHGLTMGEIALMAQGEGWSKRCDITVVPCRNYTHLTEYTLPIAPSPNLPSQRSIYLYASMCLFEGTPVSLGRGTAEPFTVYGHPAMRGYQFSFTPRPNAGAKNPPLNGEKCYGVSFGDMGDDKAREVGFTLRYLIDAYENLGQGEEFFTPFFDKLVGNSYIREMIIQGASESEIRAKWQDELDEYKSLREEYLLYED